MSRTMLCAIVSCLILGSPSRARADDEDDAVAFVKKLGGSVSRDEKRIGNPVIGVSLRHPKVATGEIKELAKFKYLAELHLSEYEITERTLAALREINLLHTLPFATGEKGKRPAKPEEVVALTLRNMKVADAGLKELAPLKNLASLDLNRTQVTNAGLKELAVLKKLSVLSLQETQVTWGGVRELTALPALAALDLSRTPVNDDGMRELVACKALTAVALTRTRVTNDGLKELARLKTLTALHLDETKVTDVGLRELTGFKALTTLGLDRYQMTDQALRVLRELNLLHALTQATTATNGRPTRPEEVAKLKLFPASVTDEGLRELAGFTNLTHFDVSVKVKDAGMREIGKFKRLVHLNLSGTDVKDESLKHLAGLKNLNSLWLTNAYITDKTAAALREVGLLHALRQARAENRKRPSQPRNLILRSVLLVFSKAAPDNYRPTKPEDVTHLDLSGTALTGAGLKEFAGFKNLATLKLYQTKVTDDELKEVVVFKHLATLDLWPFEIKDRTLAVLRQNNLLHTLSCATTATPNVTRPTKPDEVTSLNLPNSKVSDVGLKELAGFKNLTLLNLFGTKVTDEGVKELKKALPNCEIRH